MFLNLRSFAATKSLLQELEESMDALMNWPKSLAPAEGEEGAPLSGPDLLCPVCQ